VTLQTADQEAVVRPSAPADPLVGFTVGVTATRRSEELGALLVGRGARVIQAPAIRYVSIAEEGGLLDATRACLAAPVDDVVVTTGGGFRSWLTAAEGWGLADALLDRFSAARVLARGPGARGAVHAAGLYPDDGLEPSTTREILDHLLREGVRGRRIVVQPYGEPLGAFTAALRDAGAEVIEAPVYRWRPAADPAPLRRLIRLVVARTVDAVAFTTAHGVRTMLDVARRDGVEDALLEAFRDSVIAACVGPTAAAPLEARGVLPLRPTAPRLGGLVRELTAYLPEYAVIRVAAAGHHLEIRGHAAIVDGTPRQIPPAPMALLKRLAVTPGAVVTRSELLARLPTRASGSAEHAVEMAITRLRQALGSAQIIETIVKRGYRLATPAAAVPAHRAPARRRAAS
jgi:uroporphyrinogen-III synthase